MKIVVGLSGGVDSSVAAYLQIGGMYNVLYNKNKSFLGSGFIPSIGIVYGL